MNSFRGSNIILLFLLSFVFLCTHQWCLNSQLNQNGAVKTIDYAPDNKYMLTVSVTAKAVYFWNIITKTMDLTYTNYTASDPVSAKFSKNTSYVIIGYLDGKIHILNGVFPFTYISDFQSGTTSLVEIDVGWDSDRLLVCGGNFVKVYNLTTTI